MRKAALAVVVLFLCAGTALAVPSYTFEDIGTLGGDCSFALGINDSGQVVGYSTLEDGLPHAFLWEDGQMYDLNDLVECEGYVLRYAEDINNKGQIVVTGDDGYNWDTHTLVLTPRGK